MVFSCPNRESLLSWIAALRLSLWEKTRLEEIYTGHLLRMSLSDPQGKWKEPKSTLVRGRMEGWAKIRHAGSTEWKRVWVTIVAPSSSATAHSSAATGDKASDRSSSPTHYKRSRMSSIFSNRSSTPPPVNRVRLWQTLLPCNERLDRICYTRKCVILHMGKMAGALMYKVPSLVNRDMVIIMARVTRGSGA